MIYLDANATTAASEAVRSAVLAAMRDAMGNPASVHAAGVEARTSITRARDEVCLLIPGALPEGVIFTSGGTEGNNTILRGIPGAIIVTSNVEHPSVLRPAEAAAELRKVSVSDAGDVVLEALTNALPASGEVIVSIQWANSETGVIQPVDEIVAAVRTCRPDAFIHVDAAQAIGRIPVHVYGIDALTFSGHKLHGPPGTGALVLGNPEETRLQALILGGGQEQGRRSGTQNVPGAVGLGVAIRERAEVLDEATHAIRSMRDTFEGAVLDAVPGSKVNSGDSLRVPNTSNILFPGLDAMAIVARLDQKDVACSVGAACSSGRPEPSHVLLAIGLSEEEAYSSVRFSFSIMNTMDEAVRAANIVAEIAREIK